jgi:L-ribulose-5-phosphate 3-epimerase
MTNGNSPCRREIDSTAPGIISDGGRNNGAASGEGRASVKRETSVHAALFGCNTYSYMRSHSAEACLARLADQGFQEFELMVHPGHLWPADLSAEQRRTLRRLIEPRGLRLTALNMPNIDINVAGAAPEMRAYSLNLVSETVRLAGELGARGVVIGPGKANPLFPAPATELIGHFYAALDRLCPVAAASGTALWIENMPFAFLPAIRGLLDALKRYGNDAVRIVYDIANAHFIGEDFADGLQQCRARLALVHLSDTGQQAYRHDPVGLGTVPFADVPRALEAVGYRARAMLEIISRDPDRDIIASASKLAALGFSFADKA